VPGLWTPAAAPLTPDCLRRRPDGTRPSRGADPPRRAPRDARVGRTTLDCAATSTCRRRSSPRRPAGARGGRPAAGVRGVDDAPGRPAGGRGEVLRTEDSAAVHPAIGALLAERYGGRGIGLAGYREPARGALTAQDVLQWAAARFVRGAAALWLSGPPPEGLALPLPDGDPALRDPQVRRRLTTPALVEQPVDGWVSLGAEVGRQPGLAAACAPCPTGSRTTCARAVGCPTRSTASTWRSTPSGASWRSVQTAATVRRRAWPGRCGAGWRAWPRTARPTPSSRTTGRGRGAARRPARRRGVRTGRGECARHREAGPQPAGRAAGGALPVGRAGPLGCAGGPGGRAARRAGRRRGGGARARRWPQGSRTPWRAGPRPAAPVGRPAGLPARRRRGRG
jgi:hypothetical protein